MKIYFFVFQFLISQFLITQSVYATDANIEKGKNLSRSKSKTFTKVNDREIEFLRFFFQTLKGPKVIKNLASKYVSEKDAKTAKTFLNDLKNYSDVTPMPEFTNDGRLITLELQGKKLQFDLTMASAGYIQTNGRRIQFNGNLDEFYQSFSEANNVKQSSLEQISNLLFPEAHAIIPAALAVKFLVSIAAASAAYYVCKERNCKSPILAAIFSPLYLVFAGVDHMVEVSEGESLSEYLQRAMGIKKFSCPQENQGRMELVVKDDETGKLRSYALNMTNSSSFGVEWDQPYSFEIIEDGKKFARNLVDNAEHLITEKEVQFSGDKELKDSWEAREVVFKAMKSTVEFLCNKDPDIWGAVKDAFKAAKGAINLDLDKSDSNSKSSD